MIKKINADNNDHSKFCIKILLSHFWKIADTVLVPFYWHTLYKVNETVTLSCPTLPAAPVTVDVNNATWRRASRTMEIQDCPSWVWWGLCTALAHGRGAVRMHQLQTQSVDWEQSYRTTTAETQATSDIHSQHSGRSAVMSDSFFWKNSVISFATNVIFFNCKSAQCVYLTFRHPDALDYLRAKFRFFHSLHCWASTWR